MEHAGRLHGVLGRRLDVPQPLPGARAGPREGSPRDVSPGPGLQVRPGRARLPQAVLGRLPGGSGLDPPTPGRWSARVHGRDVQRAEHEPDERGDDHPQRHLRRRLPARRARRVAGHGVAARRLRTRSAVPRDHGRRRPDLELMGARAIPRVGTQLAARLDDAHARLGGAERADRDAVPERVRVDLAIREVRVDLLHGQPLLGRLVDGRCPDARAGGARGLHAVPRARGRLGDAQRAPAGRNRLLAPEPLADGHPSRLAEPVRLAEVRAPPSLASSSTRSAPSARRPAAPSPRRPGT